jgi:hypothetical protein
MLAPKQLLLNWREQGPSNEGDLTQVSRGCWENLLHGSGPAYDLIFIP